MEFHGKRCRDIFIDEKADEFEQKIEVAMMLLEDYAAQKEIPLQEALDYAELRKSYEQEMKTLLKDIQRRGRKDPGCYKGAGCNKKIIEKRMAFQEWGRGIFKNPPSPIPGKCVMIMIMLISGGGKCG